MSLAQSITFKHSGLTAPTPTLKSAMVRLLPCSYSLCSPHECQDEPLTPALLPLLVPLPTSLADLLPTLFLLGQPLRPTCAAATPLPLAYRHAPPADRELD